MKITTLPLKNTHEYQVSIPGAETTITAPLQNVQQFDISMPSAGEVHEFSIPMPGAVIGTIVLHKPAISYLSLGSLIGNIAVIPNATPLYISGVLTPRASTITISAADMPLGGMDEWTIGDYADDLQYLLSDMDPSTIGTLSGRKPV